MTNDLVINPYLQFQPLLDDDESFNLSAPIPGKGLQVTTISRSERRNLFEVFTDLSSTRFDFLDTDKDLNYAERDFLLNSGVLVKDSKRPDKPLFSCSLDDAGEYWGELDRTNLQVNPTLRLDTFDLVNFAVLSQKNLSPFGSIAWITEPVTQIRSGWWIDNENADQISSLKPGERPGGVSDTLLRKLIAAGIVGSSGDFAKTSARWSAVITKAREKFRADKYSVIPNLFPSAQMAAMRNYYRKYVAQGFMPFGDSQVEGRYRQHNEPLASFVHDQLVTLMNTVVGEPVKRSYVYAASYKEGSVLTPHTDREQCEFSISFQVDYEPEPPGHLSPWAIYVEPIPAGTTLEKNGLSYTAEDLKRNRITSPKAIYLASGDGLIYKGRELIHYRDALPARHQSTSLFFHFVAEDFQGHLD